MSVGKRKDKMYASVSVCYREERNEKEQTNISGYF